jgi:hypothetical protein
MDGADLSPEKEFIFRLNEANLTESENPLYSLRRLEECVKILKENTSIHPKNSNALPILERRVRHLQTYSNDRWMAKPNPSIWKFRSVLGFDPFGSIPMSQLSVGSVVAASTVATEVSVVPEVPITPPIILDIIGEVFDLLLQKQQVNYDQYLNFYKRLNSLIKEPLPVIIRQDSQIIYYVGDTHGSYDESIVMIRYFEKILKLNSNVRIVFLGDYVDRNPWDLENLTLIVGFYLLHREQVTLLRGNHEDSVINKNYGFYRNLMDNFIIQDQIDRLYSEILFFFINLPLIHLNRMKDNAMKRNIQIIAVHGGIPVDIDKPENPIILEKMEKEIIARVETYQQFDRYTNWLLWSDPKEELPSIVWDQMSGRSQFGTAAFDRFMQANKLDFMVRAHERWPDGYKFFFNNRMVSLFSTSVYNGVPIGKGKFLRLQPGKAPALLPINENALTSENWTPQE